MVKHHGRIALFLVSFCVLGAAARAQTTLFSTDFDTKVTVNDTTSTVTYASPDFATTYQSNTDRTSAGPTAPLATQNGWTSNDSTGPIGHGTFSTENQINGGTDYVGQLAGNNGTAFFGNTQGGAIGGIYSPSAQTPYAVPSTASGGVVTLLHAVTVPAQTPVIVFNTDFAVLSGAGASTNTVGTDTFRFVLANTGGTPILSVNFIPSTVPSNQDSFTATSGGTTVASTNAVSLNAQYHLKATLIGGATPTYTVLISGGTGPSQGFSGTLAASDLSTITQVGASWDLATKTAVNGGYTSASDNVLAFDQFSVSVPEPSTNAALAVGLLGLAGLMRSRRQRA